MAKFKTVIAIALMLTILTACGNERAAATVALDETSIKEAVIVADPQKAVDEIYASLKEYKADPIYNWQIEKLLGIERAYVIEFYGQISDANGGLADVAVILPDESKREDVRLALSKYKEQRMAEFENYDILDAYSIAQNAVIYDQGEYVIMLMLADNNSAREIIDEYIPL